MIASQNDEVITESIVAQHEKHYIENVYQDQGDPHQVALEDDIPQKVNKSVYLALFFIGLTFPASTGFTLSGPATLLVDIGLEIEGSTDNITWIVSGTTIAAAITFLIAGKFSDIYGRRHIFLIGQAFVLVGCIICSAAQNLSCLIAGNVIIGWGGGTVFVTGYSGIVEMVPNKYRFIGLGKMIPLWLSYSRLIDISFHRNMSCGSQCVLRFNCTSLPSKYGSGVEVALHFICSNHCCRYDRCILHLLSSFPSSGKRS